MTFLCERIAIRHAGREECRVGIYIYVCVPIPRVYTDNKKKRRLYYIDTHV